MRYPRINVMCPGVVSNHAGTVFSDRQVVSLSKLRWVDTLGRVKLPRISLTKSVCLAVKAQPHKHRPPLWAVMAASLCSVHCKSLPSYVFNPRSQDVSPAVQRWVDRLPGHTVMAVRLLLMLDTVWAGAGGGGVATLEESVLSRYLSSFRVHVQRSPGLLWKIPQKATGFLPLLVSLAQSFTHSVFLICFSPQENFSSALSPPTSLPKTPSLSFLSVVSLLLPTSFGKSL